MHVCDSRSDVLINAEVDSMGGVVDGRVGNGIKTSPRRAAIEKAQTELRQEYDVREERRRELEFLEKGGNPLDFKFGNTASVSVQSTSLTDHRVEHAVTSKAKGSFALTASTRGDSVESSGQPGPTTVCEPNSADNFDGQTNLLGGERNRRHISRRNSVAPSEQPSRKEGTQNAKESEDSATVRPYARRYRSRPTRDGARSTSADIVKRPGGHASSLPVRGGSRNIKLVSDSNNQKDDTFTSCKPKPAIPNGEMVSHTVEVQDLQTIDAAKSSLDKLDARDSIVLKDKVNVQPAEADPQKQPTDDNIRIHDENGSNGQLASVAPECLPHAAVERSEVGSAELNNFSDLKASDVGQNVGTTNVTKGLDSDSSCTPNSLSLDVNNEGNLSFSCREDDSIRVILKQPVEFEETKLSAVGETGKDRNDTVAVEDNASGDAGVNSNSENASANGMVVKVEDAKKSSDPHTEANCTSNVGEPYQNEITACVGDVKVVNSLDNELISNREPTGPCGTVDSADFPLREELTNSQFPVKNSASAAVPHSRSDNDIKIDRAREDTILEEARSIEAKRKRIAELSVRTATVETCKKSHWDFVLEEMTWLANDFAQERLWKMTAAAQISRRAANTYRLRVEEQIQCGRVKKVSHTMARAVMQFWQSAEANLHSDRSLGPQTDFDDNKLAKSKDACQEFKQQNLRKNGIQGYAVRFLKVNGSQVPAHQAEQPATPDLIGDTGVKEVPWDDRLTEESLFYAVPSGAIDSYRRSIELHLVHFEKTGSSLQEEDDISMVDAGADFGYSENGYENEGETSTYYLHGAFQSSRRKKHEQKKSKHSLKSFATRPYEVGADVLYGTLGPPHNTFFGKRPGSNLGPIPPKRVRTASRPRVISPFSTGVTAGPSAPAKTGASSGDTSSFQDDQSTLHGGSQIQKGMEVDSVAEFEKRLSYDCSDVIKPKKKKKARHLGSAYEQSWQLDSTALAEQGDDSRKRSENHHFDSNGTSGIYGQHAWKKPKMLKQSADAFDNVAPSTASIPSPAASQMSNMPSTNRFMRLINGRDKGRKAKMLKMSAGQPGFGSSWSLFEDQALVVLVHDMGPNWELVSDAINSTLHFKCIFRAPKECKERHKILMDKGDGDGADSAEDSGTSQSYPSTLPGIPKGSARQLFQRLQGPMEEEAIKSHFEKIIMIGKKLHYRRSQSDNQDPKHIPVHNSHVIALSQAFPNNLNGGVLTPIELIELNPSSPDAHMLGYQGSHASGLPMPSQGVVGSAVLPASGANPSVQGSSSMALGNNSPSPSGPLPASARDGRFSSPRTSLRANEHPRMQQYNQMLPGRNMQLANLPVSGPLPVGNSMGMVPGLNRGVPFSRPGFQGVPSPVPNSSGMLSPSSSGMPGGVNMQSGTVSGQPNSLMRPRDQLHMMRPYSGHPQLQHQMQRVQPQPNHATASQQQAFAIRAAKERQMQQRFLQQQQFAASGPHMPRVQPQLQQHPTSLPAQTPQISPQASPPMTQSSSMSAEQQKVNMAAHHGLNRNLQSGAGTGGMAGQMGKQRQRPQLYQQPVRNHPHQQRPQTSQTKLVKGVSRGNLSVHQNVSVDHPRMNGVSGQGLYSSSGLNQPSQPSLSKPVVSPRSSNHPQPQQKQFPATSQNLSKQLLQKPSNSDKSSQGRVPSLPATSNQHHQKQVDQAHSTVQRMVQQNSQKNPGSPIESQPGQRQYEQQPLNNAPVIPTGSKVSASAVSLDTCRASNPMYDSARPNPASEVSSVANLPPQNSSRGEPAGSASQGLVPRQLSGGFLPLQPEEQLPQQEHHPPLQLQQPTVQQQQPSQQQTHLQTVEDGMYSRATADTKLE